MAGKARRMLRRNPTRIELKPEDREEYEEAKRLAAASAGGGKGAQADGVDRIRAAVRDAGRVNVAQRIGLQK